MTRVAIGVIMKQEAPYILEWVAYHKALGFELIIADNGGTDGTTDLLSALDAAGICTRIDFRFCNQTPQIPAYRAILRIAKRKKIDIIGFLDCDEFFARQLPLSSLSPEVGANHIASLFTKFAATQISFHWIVYGSKSNFENMTLPVLERFSHHARYENPQNVRIKSFVKVCELFKPSNVFFLGPKVFSPHLFADGQNRWIIDDQKTDRYNPQTQKITHHNGAILHFIIKTWAEYQIKMKRGGGVHGTSRYAASFFNKFDLNEINDEIDPNALIMLYKEIDRLKDIVDKYHRQEVNINGIEKIKPRLLAVGLSGDKNPRFVMLMYKLVKLIDKAWEKMKQVISRDRSTET